MSNKQWGNGFHKGKKEGTIDETASSYIGFMDIARSLEIVEAMVMVLLDFEVGVNGHDGITYRHLLAIHSILTDSVKKARFEQSQSFNRKMEA